MDENKIYVSEIKVSRSFADLDHIKINNFDTTRVSQ